MGEHFDDYIREQLGENYAEIFKEQTDPLIEGQGTGKPTGIRQRPDAFDVIAINIAYSMLKHSQRRWRFPGMTDAEMQEIMRRIDDIAESIRPSSEAIAAATDQLRREESVDQ